ncbi:cyclic nucleotide-binding domain-containing protein [Emcibacter sp.]|uniref:cyclic nucleotide-binding domain-containing protein n=1 Tax=Emcibacter sp. TaxID=1979954 RepID=UPI002AA75EA3|nr:cyclic nucleotide-binding domain-containing protein [Emcibacter sp.]
MDRSVRKTPPGQFRSNLRVISSDHCTHHSACENCSVRHVAMCNALNEEEVNLLNEISNDFNRDTKQILCAEGDPAEHLYNIRAGTVRLSKMLPDGRRQITGFLFPGDFFGLACKDIYSYTAEAVTPVETCRFPRKKITEKFRELPNLGERVFDMTTTELQSAHDQMLLLGRKTAREKLCSFLLYMAEKTAALGGHPENHAYLPMSRSDVADYLGLTVETVSRQFTKLAQSGLIRLEGAHHVILLDREAIHDLAEGE